MRRNLFALPLKSQNQTWRNVANVYRVNKKIDTFIKYLLSILDRNCTSKKLKSSSRVISSEYSEFYRISFGYLHPEIQSFE